ncbi:cyclase family protein [Natrarchaeobius chitinivorans]|uniref:Cyclase family protein n=1 Tax=Natrarchaeobius chitinivorans TaxID=1679083 RepID=A0A3N6P2K7_NATCH|nr:cyclase family protein [Natrarchaeobius chitinivorans]RQG91829.1 cyclase family protein [Natrarchaeobius chitinivorans]
MYRDLSHPIEAGMQTYPGDPPVEVSQTATVSEDGVAVREICCGSHTGTHIDAPSHTEPDGRGLEDRPVSEYVFEARLVNVAPCRPRERIGPSDLPADLDESADPVDLLVVRTGYDDRWNTDAYLDHPYLAPETAVSLREAGCGVAADTLNPDPTPTANASEDEPDGFPVHRTLLGEGLPILENLRNLEGLPERFRLYAFPLPLRNADGAPVRAVAALE